MDNLEKESYWLHQVKDSRGVELYGSFEYVYFCSESCKGLFLLKK